MLWLRLEQVNHSIFKMQWVFVDLQFLKSAANNFREKKIIQKHVWYLF